MLTEKASRDGCMRPIHFFYDDPAVLYFSVHRAAGYLGTGWLLIFLLDPPGGNLVLPSAVGALGLEVKAFLPEDFH